MKKETIVNNEMKNGIKRDSFVRQVMFSMVLLMLVFVCFGDSQTVFAKGASKKALKALKGTWVTVGNSQAEVVIFTKKYVKHYSLWNESFTKKTKVKKYVGKSKIISTKKEGKNWVVKVDNGAGGLYYVGDGKNEDLGLMCQWKSNGEWQYSYSDSLFRVSKKEIYKKTSKKKEKSSAKQAETVKKSGNYYTIVQVNEPSYGGAYIKKVKVKGNKITTYGSFFTGKEALDGRGKKMKIKKRTFKLSKKCKFIDGYNVPGGEKKISKKNALKKLKEKIYVDSPTCCVFKVKKGKVVKIMFGQA